MTDKKSSNNPLDLNAERAAYRVRTILGLWHSAVGPVFQQVLGPDLSRELETRLETADPWHDDRDGSKEGEKAFICRLSRQCSGILAVIDALSEVPENISIETAIDALGRTAPGPELRQMLAALIELGPQRVMDAGIVEFADTVEAIHMDAHGSRMGGTMIVLDLVGLGR